MITTGYSGVFHFPYRINAQEELREHEATGREYRYRVHPPFLVKPKGSPVTDDVPPELWPNFRWDDSVPQATRGEQAAPLEFRYNSHVGPAKWYDGLRVDIWGPNAHDRISPFVLSFMRWLRRLSGQPWISDVDRHYPSVLKRRFRIADDGAALDQIEPFGEMVAISSFCFVTDEMWQFAFERAVWYEVPVHSNLFFDAMNAAATNDYPRAIMNLAMALESCRDLNFSRLYPAKVVEGRGPRLAPPFNHDDLLMHVSRDAQTAFKRDFSAEQPQHWPHLRNLYIARHHVGHGKGAVFPTDQGLKKVDSESYFGMQSAAEAALTWMEKLSTQPGNTD